MIRGLLDGETVNIKNSESLVSFLSEEDASAAIIKACQKKNKLFDIVLYIDILNLNDKFLKYSGNRLLLKRRQAKVHRQSIQQNNQFA